MNLHILFHFSERYPHPATTFQNSNSSLVYSTTEHTKSGPQAREHEVTAKAHRASLIVTSVSSETLLSYQ
jgi:hypothetical protein